MWRDKFWCRYPIANFATYLGIADRYHTFLLVQWGTECGLFIIRMKCIAVIFQCLEELAGKNVFWNVASIGYSLFSLNLPSPVFILVLLLRVLTLLSTTWVPFPISHLLMLRYGYDFCNFWIQISRKEFEKKCGLWLKHKI